MQNQRISTTSNTRSLAFAKLVIIITLVYALIWCYSRWFIGSVIDATRIDNKPLHGIKALELSAVFFCFFTPLLYGFCSLYARTWLKAERKLLLYIGATTMGGILGEIGIGNLGRLLFAKDLWQYTVAPVHDGYTTYMGLIIWPMYGFYLYFFQRALLTLGRDIRHMFGLMGLIIAIDAMILETLANSFSLLFDSRYIFLYTYGDLLHFTSAQIFIPYLLCGSLGAALLHYLENSKIPPTIAAAACLLIAVLLIVSG